LRSRRSPFFGAIGAITNDSFQEREMPDNNEQMIKPTMHHVNLKTNRLNEMIDWYASVIGTKVNFQFPGGAFISNDRAITGSRFWLFLGFRMTPKSSYTQDFIIRLSNTALLPT